ncbi:hypothetical protein MGE31_00060 [Wolbachia pipientis]|nr:hypothetical protein [Wolbachia pipientis]MCX3064786.1 hypothetical protein [Wolbachia endosymbiont of Drosophila pseudotakahashii]ULG97717.1 hypothetical protein MGE31_00060 [Wolbachia pipientis]ULG98925.1 hypothetical protein MGE32_00060 [Wolbachia pipientis]
MFLSAKNSKMSFQFRVAALNPSVKHAAVRTLQFADPSSLTTWIQLSW